MTAEVRANTLFVTTEGSYLRIRALSLQVVVEGKVRATVPFHHLHAVALLGNASITTSVLQRCTEAGISVTFLTPTGRLVARVDGPVSGNVLLRRQQYRMADDDGASRGVAKSVVAGKLGNARAILMHAAREQPEWAASQARLRVAADRMRAAILGAASSETADELRGQEGIGTRAYFGAFRELVRQPELQMRARTRRPPRDPLNAMLSFTYALLTNDCISALTTAGLDPAVGFFHRDRPGRQGLALDLMEEFRPTLADRTVLALVNRRQVTAGHFDWQEGGSVHLTADGRKTLIEGYHARCGEEAMHPLLGVRARLSEFVFIQARLLARHIRGELPAYLPHLLR